MPLRVACQMDPIDRIDIRGDSTFAILLEAQKRGHELFYYTPPHLALHGSNLLASGASLVVKDEAGEHYSLTNPRVENLAGQNVVLLRQDPPFDMAYVTATYLLELVGPRTLVLNDPRSVRDAPEKLFVQHFPELQPPTLISADPEALHDFRRRHGDVVLKPLHGAAGSGVVRLRKDDPNLDALLELHAGLGREPVVMQAFLPAVSEGDKRVILVEGEPVGAINRVPAKGQVRSNLRVGGRAEAVELTARDREVCAAIGPELRKRGLVFAGIDLIGGFLTEINVTSPTGAPQIKRLSGADPVARFWDAAEARLAALRR